MKSVSELLVRAADLAEAEGRALRASVAKSATGLGLIATSTAALIAGVLFVLASVFIAVAERVGNSLAALVTGVVAFVIGGIFLWQGRKIGG